MSIHSKITLADLGHGATMAHLAVENEDFKSLKEFTVEELLKTDADSETPLHYAATMGSLEMCQYIVRKCPQNIIHIQDVDGLKAYDHAVKYSADPETIDFLLLQFGFGTTKAKLAVDNGDIAKLAECTSQELLEFDVQENNSLHDAATLEEFEMCKIIMEKIPEIIHNKNVYGDTPYDSALKYCKDQRVIDYLKSFQ